MNSITFLHIAIFLTVLSACSHSILKFKNIDDSSDREKEVRKSLSTCNDNLATLFKTSPAPLTVNIYGSEDKFIEDLQTLQGLNKEDAESFRGNGAPRPLRNRVLIPPKFNLESTCHELVHHYLEANTNKTNLLTGGKWFDEGSANYFSAKIYRPEVWEKRSKSYSLIQNQPIAFSFLENDAEWAKLRNLKKERDRAYVQSTLMVYLFLNKFRNSSYEKLLLELKNSAFNTAFEKVTGTTPLAFHEEWLRYMTDYKYGFEDGLQDLYRVSHNNPWAITLDSSIVRFGKSSVRFEVRKGDYRVNKRGEKSSRAELSNEKPALMGKEYWYASSIFIPKDFPIENNRLVIGQWYPTDDEGEKSRRPVMAMRFVNGKFYITIRTSSEKIMVPNDGKEVIIYETKKFQLGRWNDFIFNVKWSYKEGGFVNTWLNKQQIANYKGPVGYNDELGPSFQFGIYRDETDKTYVLYFDEISQGPTRKSVELPD